MDKSRESTGQQALTITYSDAEPINEFHGNVSDDHQDNDNSIEFLGLEPMETLSFWDAFLLLLKKCLAMALSFTVCFEIAFSIIMLYLLSKNAAEEAASGLDAAYVNTLILLGFGVVFAVGGTGGLYKGELDNIKQDEPASQAKKDHIARLHKAGLLMAAGFSLPIIAAMCFAEPILVHIFGQPRAVGSAVQFYTRLYSLAVFFLGARAVEEQIMLVFNKATHAMAIALPNLAIGTALAYYFAFVQGAGAHGVAAGFVIEACMTWLGFALYLGWHPEFKDYRFFGLFDTCMSDYLHELKALFSLGGKILFGLSSEALIMFATSILSGLLGTEAQSIWVVTLLVNALTVILSAAFGFGVSQELFKAIGQRNYENTSTLGKAGLLASLVCVTPLPIAFAITPGTVLRIFGKYGQTTLNTLMGVAPFAALAIIFNAMRFYLLQQSRPLEYGVKGNVISLGGLFVGIILAASLAFATSLGIMGIAIGETVGSFIAMMGLLIPWLMNISPQAIEQRVYDQQAVVQTSRNSIGNQQYGTDVVVMDFASTAHISPSINDEEEQPLISAAPTPCSLFSRCCNFFWPGSIHTEMQSSAISYGTVPVNGSL